mmetsp:Transcript_3171/g.6081  ORF Transcript_3171/g.6081 Transcript_3171/m.6081 type:complete len:228 (-) Transcript_3171:67-750(-)
MEVVSSLISDFFRGSASRAGFTAVKMSALALVCSSPLGRYGTSFGSPAAFMKAMSVRTASSLMADFLSAKHVSRASITVPTYLVDPEPIASTKREMSLRAWIMRFLFLSANRSFSALKSPPSLPLIRMFAPLRIPSTSSIASLRSCHFLSLNLESSESFTWLLISTRGTMSSIFTSVAFAWPLIARVASTLPSSSSGTLSKAFWTSLATADFNPSSILSANTFPVCL